MKISSKIIGLLLLIIMTYGCGSNGKPDTFDYGSVENGVYQNEYFGFSMNLPADWVVQTQEQTENLANTGKDLVAGDDANMKAIIKASEINTANLISVFQYEVGSTVDYNPSIVIVAENIINSPGIKTGSDYLFHAKKVMEQGQFKYQYLSDHFEKKNKRFRVL